QIGPPAELYSNPISTFAAEFLGDSNLLPGTVQETGPVDLIQLDAGSVMRARGRPGAARGGRTKVLIRPENPSIGRATAPPGTNRARGTIKGTVVLGNVVRHDLRLTDGSAMTCIELNRCHSTIHAGNEVELWWRPEDTIGLPT